MSAVLNSIFQSHRRSLLGTVMRIVRDRQTAEDVAQEAYLRARQALDTRSVEHVESFLYQTARNLALDHKRRAKVRHRYEIVDATNHDIENVALDAPSAEDTIIERQRQAAYEAALLQLPVRARTAWALSQIEGRTYAEIADHLNVSRNTVYNDIKVVMGHCRDAVARLDRNPNS